MWPRACAVEVGVEVGGGFSPSFRGLVVVPRTRSAQRWQVLAPSALPGCACLLRAAISASARFSCPRSKATASDSCVDSPAAIPDTPAALSLAWLARRSDSTCASPQTRYAHALCIGVQIGLLCPLPLRSEAAVRNCLLVLHFPRLCCVFED